MDSQELAPLKSDDFRTTTFLAVSVDAARTRDGNPFCVFGPDQGMMKKACFMVGGVLEEVYKMDMLGSGSGFDCLSACHRDFFNQDVRFVWI